MAVTTNKAVLFLLGGVAAAAVVAYSAGMFGPPKPETIAALPGAGEADSKDARLPAAEAPAATPGQPPEASAPAAPEPETPAEAAPAAPAAEQAVVPPSFDVVRVEANGSIVIAGKAAPSAKVDLLVGSNVIGSAAADAGGDFAVVLDDPLKPGDYQIVLRATAPDNVVAMSMETAVVSVPETPEGQVLALVEEPGKPSQMITLPAPQAPAAEVKPPAEAPAAGAPATEASAAEAPANQPAPGAEQQAALPEPAEPAPAPATPPPAGPAVRVEAVEIDGRKIFVAGAADPGRTVRGYANEILLGDARASPDGRYLIEADRDLPVGDYIIRVDALEPDGVKVAARAAVPFEREPGETIAAVAPPAAVAVTPPTAEAPATEAPAAAATATEGTDTGGGAPATTAPPAKAQAPAEQPANGGQAPAASATEAPAAVAEMPAVDTPPSGTAPAQTEAPAAAASGSPAAQPAPEQPAAPAAEQPSATAEAPGSQAPATETQPGATAEAPASGAPAAPAQEAPAATAEAPASETPAPAQEAPAAIADAPAAETPAASETPSAEAPAATDAPVSAEPETDVASAPAGEGELPAPPSADGVTETLAPKLQSAGGAVIIRRGDSLWRISRRVYGRGVRYSTIYLANQNQIEDPDRIWPGQVFKVPEKSDNGEDADYSTLGDSLTTISEDGEPAAPAEAQE